MDKEGLCMGPLAVALNMPVKDPAASYGGVFLFVTPVVEIGVEAIWRAGQGGLLLLISLIKLPNLGEPFI
jgi:hypothetical protein